MSQPDPDTAPTTAVIVDHSDVVLDAIADLVRDFPGIRIVGAFTQLGDAISIMQTEPPDLVLLDVGLVSAEPEMIASLIASCPRARVWATCDRCSGDVVTSMLNMGLSGCVAKQRLASDLIEILEGIARG